MLTHYLSYQIRYGNSYVAWIAGSAMAVWTSSMATQFAAAARTYIVMAIYSYGYTVCSSSSDLVSLIFARSIDGGTELLQLI